MRGPSTSLYMTRLLADGTAFDVSPLARHSGEYLFPPGTQGETLEGRVLCDARRELWLRSVGRHRKTGEVRGALTLVYLDHPDFECLWRGP